MPYACSACGAVAVPGEVKHTFKKCKCGGVTFGNTVGYHSEDGFKARAAEAVLMADDAAAVAKAVPAAMLNLKNAEAEVAKASGKDAASMAGRLVSMARSKLEAVKDLAARTAAKAAELKRASTHA